MERLRGMWATPPARSRMQHYRSKRLSAEKWVGGVASAIASGLPLTGYPNGVGHYNPHRVALRFDACVNMCSFWKCDATFEAQLVARLAIRSRYYHPKSPAGGPADRKFDIPICCVVSLRHDDGQSAFME